MYLDKNEPQKNIEYQTVLAIKRKNDKHWSVAKTPKVTFFFPGFWVHHSKAKRAKSKISSIKNASVYTLLKWPHKSWVKMHWIMSVASCSIFYRINEIGKLIKVQWYYRNCDAPKQHFCLRFFRSSTKRMEKAQSEWGALTWRRTLWLVVVS